MANNIPNVRRPKLVWKINDSQRLFLSVKFFFGAYWVMLWQMSCFEWKCQKYNPGIVVIILIVYILLDLRSSNMMGLYIHNEFILFWKTKIIKIFKLNWNILNIMYIWRENFSGTNIYFLIIIHFYWLGASYVSVIREILKNKLNEPFFII